MTPENLKRASQIQNHMGCLENILFGIESNAAWPLTIKYGPNRCTLDGEAAAPAFRAQLDKYKGELRQLGVIFEPEDAVMPELRELEATPALPLPTPVSAGIEWGPAILNVEGFGVRPSYVSKDDLVTYRLDTALEKLWNFENFGIEAGNVNWERKLVAFRLRANHPYYFAKDYEVGVARAYEDLAAWARSRATGALRPRPDHLTIAVDGPQGCGKSIVVKWLKVLFKTWGATVTMPEPGRSVADVALPVINLVGNKAVTIIDAGEES